MIVEHAGTSMPVSRVVLASSSPRRQSLLQSLQLPVPLDIRPTNTDETTPADWGPSMVVEQLALRKALAALTELQQQQRYRQEASLIVGADTVVVLDGAIMGKPRDKEEAVAMLSRLQGRTHEVYSGVACINSISLKQRIESRLTHVHMKPLNIAAIKRYVASGEPMDKAGSYGIQGLGSVLVDRIEGCYFNVVGLSLSLVSDLFSEFGIEVI